MIDESDATVIEASVADPSRFETIFERHYDAICSYAQRRVGAEAGKEIASEVFVVALSRRQAFDADYPSAKPWLFGIASNLIRHQLRSERAFRRALARMPRDREQEAPLDDAAADAARLAPRIRSALSSLPSQDREAFLLLVLGDLTYQEIAMVLTIPIGTVRSKIHRVRVTLREQLGLARATTEQADDD